jgi:antitoxin MazE
MAIRSKLVRIGNSRGLRLPKTLIEQAALSDDVELRVEPGRLIVQSVREPRVGWEEAAERLHAAGADRLPDEPTSTRFDEEEWTW